MPEVDNAVNQARKEIGQRFDFKGSIAAIDLDQKANTLTLTAEDNFKLESVWDVLQTRLIKRNVAGQEPEARRHRARRRQHREAGDHAAARHPDRGRQGHRQAPEGPEAEERRPRSRAIRSASPRRRRTICRTRCRRCAPRISESRCSLATTARAASAQTLRRAKRRHVSLERALSKLGLASRSQARALILKDASASTAGSSPTRRRASFPSASRSRSTALPADAPRR